ncbi:Zinc finger12B [Apis cerana cerana]|uniref:Zinc finger12B n=1 Tax=Apis cerana cerana TaxID=94128 RepID=A0A2A3ERI8_APICC|nr:Zinc finger12B [Apis cerana cerana]
MDNNKYTFSKLDINDELKEIKKSLNMPQNNNRKRFTSTINCGESEVNNGYRGKSSEQLLDRIKSHRAHISILTLFLFALAVVAARASHFSSLEGHGLHSSEPKLISQSVHLKEIPTKIIKVTKTAVVKVPVPYPVKVPHHIPVPVPVNHPIAVPYTKLVKVQEHVPVEVSRPVPIEIHQQVPVVVPKAVPVPQPIPVPHPVTVNKPVFYPIPHPIPYQASHSEGGIGGGAGGYDSGDHEGHESESYSSYTVNQHGHEQDVQGGHFQPSQPDYGSHH